VRTLSNRNQPYSVDLADRPYVGLVGEALVAPSGRARVQIGAELATDPLRFAVFVPEADARDNAPPRLAIDTAGRLGIQGDSTLYGDLTIAGHIELQAGTVQPQSALPWHLYHLDNHGDHELRIEMAAGTGGHNAVVIGAWSAQANAFSPCLTIDDTCTVTVHGNLVVEGQLTETQPRAEPPLSQDARRFMLSGLLSGVGGGSTLLNRFYRSPGGVDPDVAAQAIMTLAPEASMQALVTSLVTNPGRLAVLADLLKRQSREVAERLRAALAEGSAEPENPRTGGGG